MVHHPYFPVIELMQRARSISRENDYEYGIKTVLLPFLLVVYKNEVAPAGVVESGLVSEVKEPFELDVDMQAVALFVVVVVVVVAVFALVDLTSSSETATNNALVSPLRILPSSSTISWSCLLLICESAMVSTIDSKKYEIMMNRIVFQINPTRLVEFSSWSSDVCSPAPESAPF